MQHFKAVVDLASLTACNLLANLTKRMNPMIQTDGFWHYTTHTAEMRSKRDAHMIVRHPMLNSIGACDLATLAKANNTRLLECGSDDKGFYASYLHYPESPSKPLNARQNITCFAWRMIGKLFRSKHLSCFTRHFEPWPVYHPQQSPAQK